MSQDKQDRATQILDRACAMMMERGYNGFSFRDIAADVGIKSASIHYHFPTKSDLAVAVAQDYRARFAARLDEIHADGACAKLAGFGEIFTAALRQYGLMCLAGVLAIDAPSLPPEVQTEVKGFFADQQDWVADVLRAGQATGEIRADLDVAPFAETFVSSLEGAMMIARGLDNPTHLDRALTQLIRLAKPPEPGQT